MRVIGRTEEKKAETKTEEVKVSTIELPQTTKRGRKAVQTVKASAAEESGSED